VVAEFANSRGPEIGTGDDIVDVVRATRPAVVTVLNLRAVRTSSTSGVQLMPAGSGSGVIFDARGYVATNAHVIENNQGVEVVFVDGRRGTAQVVGSDANYDIAILKVDGPLPAVASLADSSRLEPGMRVLAIGSPLGTEYQNTVTTGIVAGLNRIVTIPNNRFDRRTFQFVRQDMQLNAAPMIQTDAAINSGNSGGPLINFAGEVVGLNTLVVRSGGDQQTSVEGIGFAVPSNVVHTLADEWIDGIARPLLGIDYESITPDVARERNLERAGGAIVLDTRAGSAAARAGLMKGDVITAVDGIPLDLDHALTELLWSYRAGDVIKLTILRASKLFDVEVSLSAFADACGVTP
jgi:2-alkenal reductase